MFIQEDFTRLVEEQLKAKGWSRSELARQMGIAPQIVTNYLNGRNSPGPDMIERFFVALGYRVRLVLEEIPTADKRKRSDRLPIAG